MSVSLHCEPPLDYKAGQFINVFKDNTLARNYSLASFPAQDDYLTLHVRKVPDGRVSSWIHHELSDVDAVEISLPVEDCFYVAGKPEQAMLLIGTGQASRHLWHSP